MVLGKNLWLELQRKLYTYGPDVDHVINKARENQIGLLVVNARFFKPIDEVMMKDLLKLDLSITVYETDIKIGGLSSAILEFINTLDEKIHILGIEDHYVCHGSDSFFTYSRRY